MGKDINETPQEGTLNRYVLPTLTLAAPTIKGLNLGGAIIMSSKSLKTIIRIDNWNTRSSGLQEVMRQTNEE